MINKHLTLVLKMVSQSHSNSKEEYLRKEMDNTINNYNNTIDPRFVMLKQFKYFGYEGLTSQVARCTLHSHLSCRNAPAAPNGVIMK